MLDGGVVEGANLLPSILTLSPSSPVSLHATLVSSASDLTVGKSMQQLLDHDHCQTEQGEEAEAAAGGTGEGQRTDCAAGGPPRGQASASLGDRARKCTEAETRPRRAQELPGT